MQQHRSHVVLPMQTRNKQRRPAKVTKLLTGFWIDALTVRTSKSATRFTSMLKQSQFPVNTLV